MSAIDESKLDFLFKSLKETQNTKKPIVPKEKVSGDLKFDSDSDEEEEEQPEEDDNKIEFEDSIQDKNREKQFEEIEANLKKLPKLENSFDQLSNPNAHKNKKNQQQQQQQQQQQNTDTTKDSSLQSIKINDPITILHNRKKTKTEAPVSDSDKWFHIGKPELTPQLKRDLLVIKHRQALDPKRHYKKDKWTLPKNFQVGTIVEDKAEFFSSRINKKDRSSTILGSLIGDNDTNRYFKRKYTEVQDQKSRHGKSRHNYKSKNRS